MKYRKEIDGLRALAILPVIFFHGGFEWFGGGFVGVDVFFVISGYLITTIILAEEKQGTFTLAGFYERRARRILPALFFVMFVCMVFAWLWLLPDDMKQFSRSEVAVSAFASNILFFWTTGYFSTASEFKPLLHTWSLAVEEQYYLFFPLLVTATWRFGLRVIAAICLVVAIASLALAQWSAVQYPAFTFYLLPTRIWELLIGALLAIYLFSSDVKKRSTWSSHPVTVQIGSGIGLALIIYATIFFDRWTPFPSLYALVPTIGAACIILCANPQTAIGKLLGSKPFVGIGVISYSAYLWHQPLFAFARHRSLTEPDESLFMLLSLVTLLLAYLTWRYVEAPFRHRGQVSRNQVMAFSGVCVSLIVAFGLTGHFTGGFPSRYNANVIAVAKAAQEHRERPPQCDATYGKPNILNSACSLGSKTTPTGVLIGDSHADAIAIALGESLEQKHLEFKDVSFPGCPPVVNLYKKENDDLNCYAYNTEVLKELKNDQSLEYVVIVSRWTMGLDGHGENLNNSGRNGNGFDNEEGGIEFLWRPRDLSVEGQDKASDELQKRQFLQRRYADTVLEYLKANKKVILVYPIPETGWDVPAYLSKALLFDHPKLNAADGSTSYNIYKKRNTEATRILDSIGEHKNLIRVRPDQLLCSTFVKDRCITQLDGVPLYFDDDHLSNAGARLITKEIVRHMKNML